MTTLTQQLTAEELNPIDDVDRHLPGLRAALDGPSIQPLLEAALGVYEPVVSCVAEQCLYVGDSCVIRYAVDIAGQRTVLTGRLFADARSSAALLRDSLEPLAGRMERASLPGLESLVGAVPGLPMVLHAFPIDAELPALIEATDPQWMVELFRRVIPDALDQELNISGCSVEPVHYGRRHRCVLRYAINARDAAGVRQPLTAYGKVAADAEGALAGPIISALRTHGTVRVPRSLGYLPAERLALFEGIPGVPRVAQILRERIAGTPAAPGSPTLEKAIAACAGVAAQLHESGIELGPARRIEDDLATLRGALQPITSVSGPFADRLNTCLSVAESRAAADRLPMGLAHGDFSYTQLIFDEDRVGLVDFDTVCHAEPALDLGHFLAYLDFAGRKGGGLDRRRLTAEMREHFLATYIDERELGEADARQVLDRTAVYELVSLLRLAIHAWQKLKPRRLRLIVDALEDHMSGSANANPRRSR